MKLENPEQKLLSRDMWLSHANFSPTLEIKFSCAKDEVLQFATVRPKINERMQILHCDVVSLLSEFHESNFALESGRPLQLSHCYSFIFIDRLNLVIRGFLKSM